MRPRRFSLIYSSDSSSLSDVSEESTTNTQRKKTATKGKKMSNNATGKRSKLIQSKNDDEEGTESSDYEAIVSGNESDSDEEDESDTTSSDSDDDNIDFVKLTAQRKKRAMKALSAIKRNNGKEQTSSAVQSSDSEEEVTTNPKEQPSVAISKSTFNDIELSREDVGEEVASSTSKDYSAPIKSSAILDTVDPVSYTHLDVYKRQVRATSLTVESNDNNDPSLSQSASDSPSSTTASSSLSASSPSSSHGRSSSSTNVGDSTDSKPLIPKLLQLSPKVNLNLVELKLFHHYCTKVWPTIISAGISGPDVWGTYIPELAFDYPFLMHSLLAFSATHLSRTESGLDNYVSSHRLDALKLLREAVLNISDENTDALVASALILIMDSLANSSSSSPTNVNTMSPSAWIFHVKGAVTILTAVWPLPAKSKFVDLISVDLSDLGDVFNREDGTISELVCFDETISDLYPVEIDSPYLITLAYLDKLHREKNQLDFILRVFAFPALLDKTFLALLMTGDLGAMRIMRSYYKLLRGFTTEVKDKVWFLEGVSQALPSDVDSYSGGGQHMMLDFLGGGLPSMTMTNLSELL